MKKTSIMTTFVFLPHLLWSSVNEEGLVSLTSPNTPHTPHAEESIPVPHDDLTHTPSSSNSASTSTDTASNSEDSDDFTIVFRGLNALNLSAPRLQYTSRGEQLALQYDLCCTIQKLQHRIKEFEDAQHRIQAHFQSKIYLFQREINRLSQVASQKSIENKDLIAENKLLRRELSMRQSSSSAQEKERSSDSGSGSDLSSFSETEDYLGNIKASSAQSISFTRKSSKRTSSSAADFGIPPLDLQEILRQREGENY